MTVDWTLRLSDILAYAGVAIGLAWAVSARLNKMEILQKTHATLLSIQVERIDGHDEKFDRMSDRVSDLVGELQRLVGRSEFIAERRKIPRVSGE